MVKSKRYAGIDYFRFFAALLIVAIHTSPLSDYSSIADFIFTGIIARIAVPFFFITSGFFLISRYAYNNEKLISFIKKTALIYGLAIIIYLPINIYNKYFYMDNLLPNIIKDIAFDGTLYHLWYLPASVIGAVIAWYSVKKLGYTKAFLISAALYLIGLFGDSYYGISKNIPVLNEFYNLIFQITDYTRNGIFFAPVFFVMGGFIADNRIRLKFKKCILGFVFCFALMIAEGMILHTFNLQRHDSMYIFLLPSIYFLFNILLGIKGKTNIDLRTISLYIYIIHPMMIVIVRFASKIFKVSDLFIDNGIVHYITVCMLSVVFSIAAAEFLNKLKPKKTKITPHTDRSYLEVDLNNLEHNVMVLKKSMPPKCELMAVLKAEAYGHGASEIAVHLNKIGVRAFAVAAVDEAVNLRKCGILGEILILGYTAPERAKELYKYDITQTLIDYDYAVKLNKQGYKVKSHIKIDTGMHRLGFDKTDTDKICSVFSMKNIKVCGIYSHLCVSDSLAEQDVNFTKMQIDSFYNLVNGLKEKGIEIPKVHIQSSYGLLNYSDLKCDYVRVGISLYGVYSSPNDKTLLNLNLKPVLSLKSKVVLIRKIKKGESVGYARTFVAQRDSLIAVLPIGYADGYPRNLSQGKGCVIINGYKASIIGRICMDQLMIDVTDITDISVGMTAVLIDSTENSDISAPQVAQMSQSIANELLSRMGRRLPVVIKYN